MKTGTEYRWILKGYTPKTLSMARLAEYMQQVAKLLGEENSVHFVRVEKGSLALVSNVKGASSGKVDSRLSAIRRGSGPKDAMNARTALNTMVSEDNTTARMVHRERTVIPFPGIKLAEESRVAIDDFGTVFGQLYALNLQSKRLQVRMRIDSGRTLNCTALPEKAKFLGNLLGDEIQASGRGRWTRDDDGNWRPVEFNIVDAQRVKGGHLREVVDKVRKLEINWPDDPLGYLSELNGQGSTS